MLDGDPAWANSFGALDEAGDSLVAHWSEGAVGFERMRYPIHQGRSEVVPVDERVRVLVLMKGEVEVARTAIRPSVERITTVRF